MRAIAAATALALSAGIPSASAASDAAAPVPACRTVRIPVDIPNVSSPGQITGDYCLPRFSNGHVLLMVAGGTENAAYWDMPGLPDDSLVKAATRTGYAVLAIDRLGTGRSTVPSSSALVTYAAQVSTIHQVAVALHRDARLFGRQWSEVTAIGHSLGSGTIVGVAAQHPDDFNALIITGYGAQVSPETAQLNALYQVAASTVQSRYLCSGCLTSSLDDGYRTVLPGAIADSGLFYAPGTTPAALSAAAQYEGLVSKAELSTRPQGTSAEAQGALIKLPVLVADGQYDEHYCLDNPIDAPPSIGPNCAGPQAFNTYEKALFPHALLATSLIANSGHAIEEEQAAPGANALYLGWLRATLLAHPRCTA